MTPGYYETQQEKALRQKIGNEGYDRLSAWMEDHPSAFNRQVGASYYKNFKYKRQPFELYWFFEENGISHGPAAIIRRILRYDQQNGGGLKDLDKIIHECEMLKEIYEWGTDHNLTR